MPEIKEDYPTDMSLDKVPEYLASKKIEAAMKILPQGQNVPWIFAADTLIIKDGKIQVDKSELDALKGIE